MEYSSSNHHHLIIKEVRPMATEDNGFSAGAVAFAFLAGAIIGAGAALLLAPQTGAETRRLLKDYAEKAEGEFRERVPEAKAMLDSAIAKGKEFAGEKKAVLSAAIEAGREAMRKQRAS
jgi:gas vesicle protein